MPSADTAAPPATFSLFSQLPTELRLRIWNYNLPGTRIVPVRCGADDLSLGAPPMSSLAATGCTTTTPNPANLNICVESRAEAVKSYHRCFGFVGTPGHIYFDPYRDVLYFGPRRGFMATQAQFHTCMKMCKESELAAVRRIAISDSLFWNCDRYNSMTAANLTIEVLQVIAKRLPNLERLVFVPREEDEGRGDNLDRTLQRMHYQVDAAIDTLVREGIEWKIPAWHVTTLEALHDAAR
ncbi:hypothetical protein IF1G_09939 [Cordyceps javanica]|uniref:2EXR domain-containing protein n=1 Tax=Cordyceps javanica TaxID=43265 RepID=A0A545UPP8_9HYPO|nr:hypothetical protein IF1G_09939 [Cordyceps javanica]TQW03145.1 hypothetical protein IF2G_09278 [Cordyceps javanica]